MINHNFKTIRCLSGACLLSLAIINCQLIFHTNQNPNQSISNSLAANYPYTAPVSQSIDPNSYFGQEMPALPGQPYTPEQVNAMQYGQPMQAGMIMGIPQQGMGMPQQTVMGIPPQPEMMGFPQPGIGMGIPQQGMALPQNFGPPGGNWY